MVMKVNLFESSICFDAHVALWVQKENLWGALRGAALRLCQDPCHIPGINHSILIFSYIEEILPLIKVPGISLRTIFSLSNIPSPLIFHANSRCFSWHFSPKLEFPGKLRGKIYCLKGMFPKSLLPYPINILFFLFILLHLKGGDRVG